MALLQLRKHCVQIFFAEKKWDNVDKRVYYRRVEELI